MRGMPSYYPILGTCINAANRYTCVALAMTGAAAIAFLILIFENNYLVALDIPVDFSHNLGTLNNGLTNAGAVATNH